MGVIAHRVEGAGEPVVLLNGGMMSVASWSEVATVLTVRARVVRCDFRGQLLSPGEAPADLAGHAADVVALLDHLDVARAHLIGTSFGAEVGLLLAATHPQRVASLVAATAADVATGEFVAGARLLRAACTAAATGGDPRRLWDAMIPAFYSPAFAAARAADLDARREQFAALPGWWFAGVAALLATLDDVDVRPLLPRIACPTLVVVAGEDRVMTPGRGAALAAAIRGARLHVVPGAGHALVAEQPAPFAALCLEFLADVTDHPRGDRADAGSVDSRAVDMQATEG